ncbi:hypothetical protein C2G38_2231839 [Gigaspora rosea]|uniref:Uncharacterized protein n=1 Tax=Gigaspora rosea TaxID=44941 RepID=A0A397TSV4_9GLOM|nr:hypothetical protein C2G38_2231839 [Gigaspora rosea]
MEKHMDIDLTKLLDIEPNNKFALRYLEETFLTKKAIIDLAKLLGIEPSNDINESLKKKSIDAFNMCNNATNTYTLEDLENLLETKQETALKFRVKFNFIMGRYQYAIIDLTKLLDIEPNSKFALRHRAEGYYLMERYKEAIIDLTKLVGIETSDDVDESLKKKWIEAFNKCNDATNTYTLEDLENSLKIKQDTALKFRGKFNFIMGSYEDAIIDLTKLLDIEPNNKFALRYRAEAYYLMERYKKAIIDLTKLLHIEPNNKFALRYRAEAYYLLEKYKESFNDVNKLLKIESNDEWVSKHFEKICEKICENLCVDEPYELGCFYLHGINVKKDEYKAFAQFEKSANMEHTEVINCLGYCYEYGIGIGKDENKAFTYYQESADANNSNGMYQVGYCYYLGIGVEIDKQKAFTYYLKSAEAVIPWEFGKLPFVIFMELAWKKLKLNLLNG